MGYNIVFTTFLSVFVAELGDKTQLATLTLASSSTSKWQVLLGSCLALVASSVIAVLFAEALNKVITPQTIKRMAGLIFIVLGAVYLRDSFR